MCERTVTVSDRALSKEAPRKGRGRTHGVFRDAVLDVALHREDELHEEVQEHEHERQVEEKLQIPTTLHQPTSQARWDLSGKAWWRANFPLGKQSLTIADANGYPVKIAYGEVGSGKPLFLLHGIGSWSYNWRNSIKPLSQYFRVTCFDAKG